MLEFGFKLTSLVYTHLCILSSDLRKIRFALDLMERNYCVKSGSVSGSDADNRSGVKVKVSLEQAMKA